MLNGKAIELREKGLENKVDPVSEDEKQMLWDSGVLGDDNPELCTLSHIGTRGRQEHQSSVERERSEECKHC